MTLPRLIPLFAFTGLVACGGSEGSGPVFGVDVTLPAPTGVGGGYIEAATFSEIATANDALRTAIFDDNRFPTTTGSGVVDMTGYLGVSEVGNEDESIVGNMSLTVDFDVQDVTGSVGDIAVYDTTGDTPVRIVDMTGTLTLTGGAAGSGFAADVTGVISDGSENYTLDLDLGGDLYDVDGTKTYVGGVNGSYFDSTGTTTLEGEFLAQ